MAVPTITMTMLGASGSGKTAYLHGMYNRLSSGVQGYYLYTIDPDQDLDLADHWSLLRRNGTMPKATSEEPRRYDFIFRRGMRDLVEIDCTDFRGNAALDRRGSAADVHLLEQRLAASDSIVLVLDSEHVAQWVRAGTPGSLDRDDDPMEIARFSRAISGVFTARKREGGPSPAIVVLLTKVDLLSGLTGMTAAEALVAVAKNLGKLVPALADDQAEGVTVALCPVQLGNFGAARLERVDSRAINPKNLHLPIVFSLRHYLTEGIARNQEAIRELTAGLDSSRSELAALSRGFMGGFFQGARKTAAQLEIERLLTQGTVTNAMLQQAQEKCRELDRELRGIAIYRDGRLLTD
ncbi:hypothetical protein GCM10009665_27670 [Kitasatospora nipponensis]|uniref:Uncharacterized protein n=1 Tax=Kitasatospora nipponensis TaxID=258049 RepID=A0ABN1W5T0_9ACTN